MSIQALYIRKIIVSSFFCEINGKNMDKFLDIWTYKEAFVKMTGEGISDNIKNYSYNENNCITEICDDYVLTVITGN